MFQLARWADATELTCGDARLRRTEAGGIDTNRSRDSQRVQWEFYARFADEFTAYLECHMSCQLYRGMLEFLNGQTLIVLISDSGITSVSIGARKPAELVRQTRHPSFTMRWLRRRSRLPTRSSAATRKRATTTTTRSTPSTSASAARPQSWTRSGTWSRRHQERRGRRPQPAQGNCYRS